MTRATVLAAALLAACAGAPTPMRVIVQPPAYAVTMSSTRGLGLTPVAEAPPGLKVRYRWTADGGYFLTEDEHSAEVVSLGRETVTAGGKLFWSYEPGEEGALADRGVLIKVVTESVKNGKVLAATDFTLIWDGAAFRAKH